MSDYIQGCFEFLMGGDPERVERDMNYAQKHPQLEEQIVAIMRELVSQGLTPSVHSALVRIREQGGQIWDGAKAFYGRMIARKYPDLARYIRTAPSALDRRV